MIRENNESNTSKIVNGGLVVMRLNRFVFSNFEDNIPPQIDD